MGAIWDLDSSCLRMISYVLVVCFFGSLIVYWVSCFDRIRHECDDLCSTIAATKPYILLGGRSILYAIMLYAGESSIERCITELEESYQCHGFDMFEISPSIGSSLYTSEFFFG